MDDETKKMAAKYPKLKDSFDILNEKYLEAEQRLEKMEKQVASEPGSLNRNPVPILNRTPVPIG